METGSNKLVFELDGRRLALRLCQVDGVVEADRVFFIPGQKDPVKGIITRRGQEVAVVDLRKVMGLSPRGEGKKWIVIARDGKRFLGLYIGEGKVSLMWKEKLTAAESDGKSVEFFNWSALYDEVASILSGGEKTGEDTHS
jgi:chemotaxis signal transduction protein